MERVKGVEPSLSASQAVRLPLTAKALHCGHLFGGPEWLQCTQLPFEDRV